MNRKELLKDLLNFKYSLAKITSKLNEFGWDSDEDLVIIKRSHLLKVLHSYINGKIEKADVENWANIIECREDIGTEKQYEDLINDVIYELANPYLTEQLTKKRAKIICDKLVS
jgi:hypothetical protein